MSNVKFLQFGCWNNRNPDDGNKPKKVIELVEHLTKDKTIEFIIVSGDNYYPYKDTESKKNIYLKID